MKSKFKFKKVRSTNKTSIRLIKNSENQLIDQAIDLLYRYLNIVFFYSFLNFVFDNDQIFIFNHFNVLLSLLQQEFSNI